MTVFSDPHPQRPDRLRVGDVVQYHRGIVTVLAIERTFDSGEKDGLEVDELLAGQHGVVDLDDGHWAFADQIDRVLVPADVHPVLRAVTLANLWAQGEPVSEQAKDSAYETDVELDGEDRRRITVHAPKLRGAQILEAVSDLAKGGHFAYVDLPNANRGTVFHVVVPR